MKFCSKCGTQLNDDDLFCFKCGYKFPENVQQQYVGTTEANQQVYQTTAAPVQTLPPNQSVPSQPGNKKTLILIIIIVAAAILIALGIILPIVLTNKNRKVVEFVDVGNVEEDKKESELKKIESDMMLCDSVKMAITTSMMDPVVISDSNANIPTNTSFMPVSNIAPGYFRDCVEEILGFSVSEVDSHLKSHYSGSDASGVQFAIVGSNSVHVQIVNSDKTGKKGKNGASPIYVD